ncbi:hypothetical protein HQ590_11600 [bacterium]|nr:hypothetical protein [bacterium]
MTRLVFTSICVFLVGLTVAVNHANAQTAPAAAAPTVIVAEGEFFTPQAGKARAGWKLTPQDQSYASHTYGGMWVMNGALIGAPAQSVGAVATQQITVPVAGAYRVWSKYQAPPYFNYRHKLEIVQGGKTVFSHVYGKVDAPRFWSFSAGMHPQIWWFWGMDHDAAESPKTMANLVAGEAELQITSVAQPEPAGDRFIDFIVLTTEPEDTYQGYQPRGSGSPFMFESLAASRLYARFKNTTDKPAVLTARATGGHMVPLYWGQSGEFPTKDQPVAPGQWSPWFNLAKILRLAHDEGVIASLPGDATFDFQIARDQSGQDLAADFKLASGETFVIPKDIAWNRDAKVLTSREHAAKLVELAKTKWRTANGGKKPQKIAFYGDFRKLPNQSWADSLKDALGYNTLLPDPYPHLKRDGYGFTYDAAAMQKYASSLTPEQRVNTRILSFGDEVQLGEIDYNSAANLAKFRAWLQKKGLTKDDLGVDPAAAPLTKTGDPRLVWYANLFNEEERFAPFAANTRLAEQLFHPDVLTGANYSPHHAPQYYGPIFQWVDLFKYRGMKAFWTEDYIFSVPESPQIISWMFATMRCGVKYHDLPIHCYVMPHAPGQTPGNLRRNTLFAVGAGALDIDNFWVAPAENVTENYVAWGYLDTFRVIHESIYDSAEIEDVSVGGKPRPARVAIILSKATDFNESKLTIDPKQDPFASQCGNVQGNLQQTLCRKDQQMLYLALRNAQHSVELITEDDMNDGVNGKDILANYEVIYFAGEWIDNRAARKLDAWVKNGGVLYATAGLGHLNQFNQPEPALLALLGLKSVTVEKNAYHLRPLLELPLVKPIDTITLDGGGKIPAIAMKQVLTLNPAAGAKVVGKWTNGDPAVTVRDYGKGKAIAVGTLAGHSFFKTGTKVVPFARGGYKNLYAPLDFDPAATKLALLGVDAKPGLARDIVCSNAHIEAQVLDNQGGTLVTLVNWANEPAKAVKVVLALPFKPSAARLVSAGKAIPVNYEHGAAVFTLDVSEAEFVLLNK